MDSQGLDFSLGLLASGKGWYQHTQQQEQDQTDGLWVTCRLGPWSYREQARECGQSVPPALRGAQETLHGEAAAGQVAAGFPSWVRS